MALTERDLCDAVASNRALSSSLRRTMYRVSVSSPRVKMECT
jgi:hypothetical protein